MAYAAWTKGTAAMLLAIRELARREGVEETLLGRVGPLPARAARPVRPRAALGRGEGLALGRRDGGDRRNVRGGRAPGRLPPRRGRGLPRAMSAGREELTCQAARLFGAEGLSRHLDRRDRRGARRPEGSLYAHIASKQDLLYETMAEGARAFHAGLDAIPEELPATEKIRPRAALAPARRRRPARRGDRLRAGVALSRRRSPPRDPRRAARRYEERIRALFREGREARRAAQRPRRRDRRAARARRLRTGPTRGCGPAPTPTSRSRTGSTSCCRTGCALRDS